MSLLCLELFFIVLVLEYEKNEIKNKCIHRVLFAADASTVIRNHIVIKNYFVVQFFNFNIYVRDVLLVDIFPYFNFTISLIKIIFQK